MAFLSKADEARVLAAVRAAEARSSAEFVTVIARAADSYLLTPALAASAVALLLPGLLWLAGWIVEFAWLYALQLAVFLASLAILAPFGARLTPRSLREAAARRLAHEQFLDLGLSTTEGRNGVLLFVSAAEHYVEILADCEADRVAPPGFWPETVAAFTAEVRAGRTADGFIAAIERIGGLLEQAFPRAAGDANELPDRLVRL
jgi:putative membrane protein